MNLETKTELPPVGNASSRIYEAPRLKDFGRVSRLTMGNGGSSIDGGCSYTQRGGGNNETGPKEEGDCFP